MKYTALKRVKSSKTGQYIEQGGEIDLSHLTKEQVDLLISKGAVKPVAKGSNK